ncbi:AMP-binding protein, partial [Deinococcus sp.]|uniref:AMP-binding protein n=1 Tax=Deinococcus sp. TaxID=47478 RepID=UPI002869D02B
MNTPLTPLNLVRRGLSVYPNKTAVIQPGGPHFTYREWGARVFQLARAVQAAGHAGTHVAVLSPNTHQGLLTYSGVPWAGSVLVPLNTRLMPEEYAFQLRHAEVKLLLVDETLHERVQEVAAEQGIDVWVMGQGEVGAAFEARLAAQDGSPLPIPVTDEDATITINFTSGTT